MAQIWVSYQELADELGCSPSGARSAAIAYGWVRKHSMDGKTRVLLPREHMQRYILRLAQQLDHVDQTATLHPTRLLLAAEATGSVPSGNPHRLAASHRSFNASEPVWMSGEVT